jgi:hypothetical protein
MAESQSSKGGLWEVIALLPQNGVFGNNGSKLPIRRLFGTEILSLASTLAWRDHLVMRMLWCWRCKANAVEPPHKSVRIPTQMVRSYDTASLLPKQEALDSIWKQPSLTKTN